MMSLLILMSTLTLLVLLFVSRLFFKKQKMSKEKICTKCGNTLKDGELFCGECGSKLEDIQNESSDDKINKKRISKIKKTHIVFLIILIIIIVIFNIIINIISNIIKHQKEPYHNSIQYADTSVIQDISYDNKKIIFHITIDEIIEQWQIDDIGHRAEIELVLDCEGDPFCEIHHNPPREVIKFKDVVLSEGKLIEGYYIVSDNATLEDFTNFKKFISLSNSKISSSKTISVNKSERSEAYKKYKEYKRRKEMWEW